MTEFITEFDMYEAALRKVNLNENVLPYVRGRLLTENVEIYAKIQKLLNCDPMQTCHRWLYDLDIENLDESEICRVNNLYKLGCDRGYLIDDEEVELYMVNPKAPCFIKNPEESYIYLILPVNFTTVS